MMDPNIVTRAAPGTCAVCGGTTAHWLPMHKATGQTLRAQNAAEDAAAEQAYADMLAHPESVIDAPEDLF